MGLTLGRMTKSAQGRSLFSVALDASLGVFLAVLPLLPTGPGYAGLPPISYVALALPVLFVLWALGRFEGRGRISGPFPMPLAAWHITIGAIVGAALLGLMAENHFGSRVFLARLADGAGDLFRPMDQAAHPLYPLRVALIFLEGWLVILLTVDLCRRAVDPARRARAALTGWLTGFVLVSAFAIVQFLTRFQLHPYWVKANPNIVRAHSTLDDPNALGAYLVLGIGLIVGFLHSGDRRRRAWWIALLALGAFGLLTTMSRAALGAAVLAPLGILAVVPRPVTRGQNAFRVIARLAIATIVIVLLGSGALRMFITDRARTQPTNQVELVVKTFDPRESTDWVLRGRLAWWAAAVRMIQEDPLTGVGLGRYPRMMGAYGGGRSRENAHNLFLQLFAESGIPGGMAFAALCISLCVAFVRKLRDARLPEGRALALGGLIAAVGFLLTLLTGHSLLVASGQTLFASFIGVAGALATWAHPPESTRTPVLRRAPVTARPLLLTAVVLGVLAWYPAIGIVRGVAPPTGAWGDAWGLFPAEDGGMGVSYRWTSARALLDLDIPSAATAIDLPVAAPSPIRGGEPARVRVAAGGIVHEMVFARPDVQTIRIPLDTPGGAARTRLLIDIQVHPTFIPSRLEPQSRDHRVLGVQVLRPRFVTSASLDTP